MNWACDVLRQSLFMSLFIIPVPVGAYTIHNGSSAAVAAVSYAVLSVLIPLAYVGTKEATFGMDARRIRRGAYMAAWLLVSAVLVWAGMYMDVWWKEMPFWEWPTVARDVVFIIGMYAEVAGIMLVSCVISQVRKKEARP